MNTDQRNVLLDELIAALDPAVEEQADPLSVFLPLRMHGEVLDDAKLVIEGERGSGKTALFQFLSALKHAGHTPRDVFPNVDLQAWTWVVGFEEKGREHPARQALCTWGGDQEDAQLELFWLGHLAGQLSVASGVSKPPSWRFLAHWRTSRNEVAIWAPLVAQDVAAVYDWLDQVESKNKKRGETLLVGYDDLDRISDDGHLQLPARFSATLVRLWLGLRKRLTSLRAKIFLRPDLYKHVRTAGVDASKLDGHVVRLDWRSEDVFRVVLRRMYRSGPLRAWLQEQDAAFAPDEHAILRWMPRSLPEEEMGQLRFPWGPRTGPVDVQAPPATQQAFAQALAGTHMGSGPNKGRTHRWILNHSRDGLGRALPRVTLNLLRNAAQIARDRATVHHGEALLSPSDLEAAQRATGDQRLAELRESHPVAWRMEHLHGAKVPLAREQAVQALTSPHPNHPDDARDGEEALKQLIELGVMIKRDPAKADPDVQRVDVPDLFRRPLDMKRHGGPLQLRPR